MGAGIIVTVQYYDGTHKARTMEPEDAAMAMREMVFRLASSKHVVAVTACKSDPVSRLMDGRMEK